MVISAPVYLALGAALAYYVQPFLLNWEGLFLILMIVFVLILSFFRVLVFAPFLFKPMPGNADNSKAKREVPRYVLMLSLLLNAGIAGICLGFSARAMLPLAAYIPLSQERVIGIGGILKDDPRAFNDNRGIGSMEINFAQANGGLRVSAKGKIQVYFPGEAISRLKEFGRGSEIYVEGRMLSDNQGLLFLASGVYIVKPAPALEQIRTNLRSAILGKFRLEQDNVYNGGKIENNAPVWAGLASALLLGIRDNLDTDFTTSFRNAGVAHVLALSGMHLAILSAVIFLLFRLLLGLRWASVISAVFVIMYIFIAGAQPSLVRSGIIYLLGTLALLGFLKKDAFSLLALAFVLQIFIQNESGVTVSFILSYTALIGILLTGETIHTLLRGRVPEILNRSLSVSLGAFIATMGVTAYYFGVLRPIGLIAGIFIMPLISLFMVLAFAALILICLIPILFEPLSFVLTLVYRLMELIVSLAGVVPGFKTMSLWPALFVSLILVVLLEFIKYRDNKYRGNIPQFSV